MAKRNNQVSKGKFSKNKNLMNVKIIKNTFRDSKNSKFGSHKDKRETVKSHKEKNKSKTNLQKQEEEIEEIENENQLFYGDKYEGRVEVNEDDWNANSDNLVSYTETLFDKMNAVEEKKFHPKIVETYTMLGDVLHDYTSGKLPKAFNVLPVTENWEEIIMFTNPMNWSPQAYFEATKMFASNLNAALAEIFYSKVLLPRVRADIKQNNKLNIHFYNCLKKAIFKPSGFFKGIIIPLSDSTTAKEASIIGSIIKKCSIPSAHSAACIMKLMEKCKDKFSMGALFFIKMLLLKKYALPSSVKDAMVKFFVEWNSKGDIKISRLNLDTKNSAVNNTSPLPVLWHQTLLVFVQIYKLDLTELEKVSLRSLIEKKSHHLISEEILRELNYKPPQINFKSGHEKLENMKID